jgi:hypothetical protein
MVCPGDRQEELERWPALPGFKSRQGPEVGCFHRRQAADARDEIAGCHLLQDVVDADGEVARPVRSFLVQGAGLVRPAQATRHDGAALAGTAPACPYISATRRP